MSGDGGGACRHAGRPRTGRALALVSGKGSPGVTTSAVLLAAVWPAGATLLEADPAGGDLRTLLDDLTGQPLRQDVGVVSLLTAQSPPYAGAAMTEHDTLADHIQQLPGGMSVLLGPASASQTEALRSHWDRLPEAAARHVALGGDVVVDAGRLADAGSVALGVPLLRVCDLTLVVVRATPTSVSHARDLLSLLQRAGVPVRVLLIADSRDADDVNRALHVPAGELLLLPVDPHAASALFAPWTRRLDRSRLLSQARRVATALTSHPTAAEPLAHATSRRGDEPAVVGPPTPGQVAV